MSGRVVSQVKQTQATFAEVAAAEAEGRVWTPPVVYDRVSQSWVRRPAS